MTFVPPPFELRRETPLIADYMRLRAVSGLTPSTEASVCLVLDHMDRTNWNGHLVSEGQLIAALAATRELPVERELQFAPDPAASYDAAARTLRTIKTGGVTKFGFVGNERFRTLSD